MAEPSRYIRVKRFSIPREKSRPTYRIFLGLAAAAEFIPQGPSAHADAHDEDASRCDRYQGHRHVLRRRRGGGCDLGAQCGTFDLVHVDGVLRDADAVNDTVHRGLLGSVRFELRGFGMVLLRRQRRQGRGEVR